MDLPLDPRDLLSPLIVTALITPSKVRTKMLLWNLIEFSVFQIHSPCLYFATGDNEADILFVTRKLGQDDVDQSLQCNSISKIKFEVIF